MSYNHHVVGPHAPPQFTHADKEEPKFGRGGFELVLRSAFLAGSEFAYNSDSDEEFDEEFDEEEAYLPEEIWSENIEVAYARWRESVSNYLDAAKDGSGALPAMEDERAPSGSGTQTFSGAKPSVCTCETQDDLAEEHFLDCAIWPHTAKTVKNDYC